MTPEEIKKLQEKVATLEKKLEDATATIEKQKTTLEEKDAIIEQKNQDVIGARRKYKKLSEMSEDEKKNMTPEEIARKEEQDLLFEQQEETARKAEEDRQKEVNERKLNAVTKLVGDNEELKQKVLANYDRIKDSDAAFTESEVATFVSTAFNMLGEERPDPVRASHNEAGNQGVAPIIGDQGAGNNFSETEAGKGLAASMGLQSAQQKTAEGGDDK